MVSAHFMTGADEQSLDNAERSHASLPIGASGIHRGTEPVLQCLSSDKEPCGKMAGPRLKRASGPLQGNQLFRLKRSAGAGFEPASG